MDSQDGNGTDDGRIERTAFPFEIQKAATDDDGRFRVTGVMSTYGVMRSRRVLHPRGFMNWLKRNKGATLPMLANHGAVEGFASIGVWDRFEHVEGRGMHWSGYLAEGVKLADNARRLLEQKILRQLSVGWFIQQARYVRRDDLDLDPHLKRTMEAAEVESVYAILDWYPVEGSIVDVADDPGELLAARMNSSTVEAALAPLKAELEGLRADVQELAAPGGEGQGSGDLRTLMDEFIQDFTEAAIEALQTDPLVIEAAHGRRDGLTERDTGSDLAALQQRVADFGSKERGQ